MVKKNQKFSSKKNLAKRQKKASSCRTSRSSASKKNKVYTNKNTFFRKSSIITPTNWHEFDDDELERELEKNKKEEKLEKIPARKK